VTPASSVLRMIPTDSNDVVRECDRPLRFRLGGLKARCAICGIGSLLSSDSWSLGCEKPKAEADRAALTASKSRGMIQPWRSSGSSRDRPRVIEVLPTFALVGTGGKSKLLLPATSDRESLAAPRLLERACSRSGPLGPAKSEGRRMSSE